MPEDTPWMLTSPPDTLVRVAPELVELERPLVRVVCDEDGKWSFNGPGDTGKDDAGENFETMKLGDVVVAWPHVAGLDAMRPGSVAVWVWQGNAWAVGAPCDCGRCASDTAVDLADELWPAQVPPNLAAHVDTDALAGEIPLGDVQCHSEGFTFVGQGQEELDADRIALMWVSEAVRRWPHALAAVGALTPGIGVKWSPERLHWDGYQFTMPA